MLDLLNICCGNLITLAFGVVLDSTGVVAYELRLVRRHYKPSQKNITAKNTQTYALAA
ncbi:hypothetical protein LP2241_CDS1914674D [Pseudolactococcus piscium]|nr:hypothetical protein LP2241_CDS1914674D [Lactococcus piscium]